MSRDIASDIGCRQETDTYTDEDAVSAPLVRNRFHPGKLMDVRHWYLEQDYHRRTAALSARLGLGPGVLCGLDVELCDDESLVVGPGVALDGRGRLIIVERPVRIDRPEVPTDCLGRPDGEPVHDGTVAVRLCHHECGTEYVRTSSADCDPHEDCVPSLTAERFMLRITEGEPKSVGLSEEQCAAVFPVDKPEDFDRRRAIARHIDHDCGCGHDDGCVVLATLRFSSERDTRLNAVRSRPVVYSNRVLFELLLCLAARVDACCDALPSPAAPRIAGIWPPPISRGQGTERQRVLTEEHRLEITFDRDLREPALDSPDAWLGVWQLDAAGARRVRLERVGGELRHLVPPPGGEGVVYRVVFDEPLHESAGVAILARVEPTGEPRAAGGDRLSLDAEFPATELTDDDREKLWGLAPGSGVEPSLSDLRNRLVPSALPQLPSGNRLPGGELHMAVLRPEALAGTGEPPRLLRVWPEGAARLDGSSDRDRRQWASFLRHPRVELTVDRPIAAEALAEPGAWVRLFAAVRDDGIRSFRRIELEPGEIAGSSPPEHDGAVTYRFRLAETLFDADDGQCRAVAVLLQVRSADAFVPPPVGADAPNQLLDADFAGTGLDKQTLFTIWQGGQPAHWIAELAPRTTDGATLCDGTPGGFVHTAFTVAAP